jgi:ATP-dependent DNA helicase RecQ
VEKDNARRQLESFLAGHAGESGIVYCLSRKKTEETADWLNERGFSSLPYHAGMDAATRSANQQRFLREDGIVMCATIAFGMGIDKPDVRFVAHLDLPKSLEATTRKPAAPGATGCRPKPGCATDWRRRRAGALHRPVRIREERKRNERAKLDALLGFAETTSCRRQRLLRYFGESLMQPCGNCDNCLEPAQTWDGSVAAQKALSCVIRTGQRYGVGHLIAVLRGEDDERVRNLRHDALSTFGIGTTSTSGNGEACSANWSPPVCSLRTTTASACCA